MSTTRFALYNYCTTATLDLVHGGGARHDDASGTYPFERCLTPDRRSLWKTDGTNNVIVVMDLGSIRTIAYFGLQGYRRIGSVLTSCQFETSLNGSSWTVRGSAGLTTGRDAAYVPPAAVSGRYVRLTFSNTGAFTVGRIFIADLTDIGKAHSPGARDSEFQNRAEQGLQSGYTNVNVVGDPGRDFTLPFVGLTGSERDVLRSVAAETGSVVLVDAEDAVFEVIVRSGRVETSRQFVDRYDCSLELTRLP